MTTSIRKADANDAEVLAVMNQTVQDLHVAHRPDYFKRVDPNAIADWFRSMLQKSGVRAWIAEFDGSAVGYALTVTHDRAETAFCSAWQSCEIDQIAVLSPYRRMGIARALVACAFEDARSRGIRDLELTSWSFNTEAHEAFQALGFIPKILRFGQATF
jgi:ribosomal protein S18 acetylase RimI-like enzyme